MERLTASASRSTFWPTSTADLARPYAVATGSGSLPASCNFFSVLTVGRTVTISVTLLVAPTQSASRLRENAVIRARRRGSPRSHRRLPTVRIRMPVNRRSSPPLQLPANKIPSTANNVIWTIAQLDFHAVDVQIQTSICGRAFVDRHLRGGGEGRRRTHPAQKETPPAPKAGPTASAESNGVRSPGRPVGRGRRRSVGRRGPSTG